MYKFKWIAIYIVCISLIILISIMGDEFNQYIILLYSTYFKTLYFWLLPVYPILIGCLIALPQFIKKVYKIGTWHFDWQKFLIMGMPALYIAFSYMIYFGQLGSFLPVIHSQQFYIIGGIVFGNVLITSFDKQT